MNIACIISLIFSALCNFKASKTFMKDKSNFCHRNILMKKNNIFLCPCSVMGAVKIVIGLLVPDRHWVKVRLFKNLIFWNIWKIFCSVWYLMLAFVLQMLSKIFRTNILTYVNFSWRHYDRLQWGWWYFVAGFEVIHLFLLASGWRKIWCGIWKKVVFSAM